MVSQQITNFLFNLKFSIPLPEGFEVLNPYDDPETRSVCEEFYNKYYNDVNKRFCIIGINPGRFGAGITGIPFTDPIRLESELGIQNKWSKKQELSSVFIYEMINAFGGPHNFYSQFYFTAVSPLGLVKNGKNINYYDDKTLLKAIPSFAESCLKQQLHWINTSVAFCLGEGKNYDFMTRFNNDFRFFEKIVPLPHPRYIMQYKLKAKEEYIDKYCKALKFI